MDGLAQTQLYDIQIGQMTAFLNYLIQILISVMMSTMLLFLAPRSAVSANRILEVLDTEPTVAPPADPVAPQELTGVVEFRDVTFTYPGAEDPVLTNVAGPGRRPGGPPRRSPASPLTTPTSTRSGRL